MTTITADAHRVLAELGSTPDEVAQTLWQDAIVGTPGAVSACPVSVYLSDRLNEVAEVATFSERVHVTTQHVIFGRSWADAYWVELPDPVKRFILRFDRGDYVELDESCAEELLAQSVRDEQEMALEVSV